MKKQHLLLTFLAPILLMSQFLSVTPVYASASVNKPCKSNDFMKIVKSGSKSLICLVNDSGNLAWEVNGPAEVISPYYTRGYNAIMNSTQDGLVSYGYYSYLNARSQMTSANAKNWCIHVMRVIQMRTDATNGWTSNNVADWEHGCAAAAVQL
jgi:hypothetical protein